MGDYVKMGETLAVMHANDPKKADLAEERFKAAYTINDYSIDKNTMIKMIIT